MVSLTNQEKSWLTKAQNYKAPSEGWVRFGCVFLFVGLSILTASFLLNYSVGKMAWSELNDKLFIVALLGGFILSQALFHRQQAVARSVIVKLDRTTPCPNCGRELANENPQARNTNNMGA